MAKSTVKNHASDSESDAELTKSAKKSAAASKVGANDNKGRAAGSPADEDEDGSEAADEEEYEIEAILDAKHGAFADSRTGYLVKWKGYDESHNSWVDEKDAVGATELIDEFWAKNNKKSASRRSDAKPKAASKPRKSAMKRENDSDDEEVPSVRAAKKRGRLSQAHSVSEERDEVPKKKQRKSTGGGKNANANARRGTTGDEEDEEEYTDMKKWKDAQSWEHLIECIDTVERTDDGELYVYFTLKNGRGHGRERSDICKKKMPYMLIEFYESNLRWKQTDEAAMEE